MELDDEEELLELEEDEELDDEEELFELDVEVVVELDVEEELLELEEDEEPGEDVGVLLFDEDTEPIGLELGAPAQLTTSIENKVVVNNCLFINISPS